MNRYAAALGLADTHYANPIGLDAKGNYSSARDLATLTRRLLRDPGLREDRRRAQRDAAERPTRRAGSTTINELLLMAPWVTGVKTGHTWDAGYVLVGSGARRAIELISVAIGAPTDETRFSDNLELLEYGFSQYRRRKPVQRGRGARRSLDPLLRRRAAAARRATRRGRRCARARRLSVEVDAPDEVEGPIRRGAAARQGDGLRRRAAGRQRCRCWPAARSRGERLRPGPRLRRRTTRSLRGRGVRDTDWRGSCCTRRLSR